MRHCSPDELMDVVEGTRPDGSLPHLTACTECRRQLIELRAALDELREVSVPEPSPLQWARLSARVRDAVASEVERSRSRRRTGWAWLVPVAVAAMLMLALIVPGLKRSGPPYASGVGATASGNSNVPAVAQPADDGQDDPALGLMFDLAGVVDLDSDRPPVLAMGEGIIDQAVSDLSADEQHELARLLQEAIERPGA